MVEGNGLAVADVTAAMPGHDAVLVAVGNRSTLVSADIIRNVIAAMKASGVRRVVLLSAYEAGDSGHGLHGFIFRTALRRLNADKMAAEEALSASGLDWTAVRSVALNDKPAAAARPWASMSP
jgi:uncharacterized protein YbjT (DUF2867 family)